MLLNVKTRNPEETLERIREFFSMDVEQNNINYVERVYNHFHKFEIMGETERVYSVEQLVELSSFLGLEKWDLRIY